MAIGGGPAPGQGQQRNCVSCGRGIAWDVNVCPYCGHDYRPQMTGQMPYGPPQYAPPRQEVISSGMKILLYLLSFFIPIVGFIIGAIYYTRPETKEVGKMCLILGVLSIVLAVVCYVIIFIVVASSVWWY